MLKKIAIIWGIALICGYTILPRLTLAQSSAVLESRISRLESENFQLRSQISRIESQLSALSGRSLPQSPTPNQPAPPVTPRTSRQALSSDPMFDRLATLVIELKERIQVLEQQVAELKRPSR
ncbi:MAG TPA: hypothetical protein DDZ80_06815 [Cyanobacteria bacterium UBA8803]|nr:hypothetical protein [Cyanobacteria bacterium UBA9273]HBL58233.1 hypothetical protein [Cyanobacteria bacterium UBA8803]